MGRKLKYKDVVKKGPKNQGSRGKGKRPEGRKTYSIYKQRSGAKRKPPRGEKPSPETKRARIEDKPPPVAEELAQSSSESEEEMVQDPMVKLRDTFPSAIGASAIVSESSSEEDEEAREEISDSPALEDSDGESEDEDVQEDEGLEGLEDSEDPFTRHVSHELHPLLLENLESSSMEVHSKSWPRLRNLVFHFPKCEVKDNSTQTKLERIVYAMPGPVPKRIDSKSAPSDLFIKPQLNLFEANKALIKQDSFLTPLQQEVFSIVNNYQDLYYPERTFENAEEIRFVYCLHAVNHVLKTRTKVVHHNAKLSKKEDVPEEFRDQGLVRPKVLIVAPFKDSAFKIVNTIIDLMFKEDKGNVIKRSRFIEDYTGNELYLPKKNPKPEDYERTFSGNTSDDFRIGMSVTKKSLKLYSDFYSSDIIVASPLGLRTIIGAEGEAERDFDFLTSIELLVLDQAEIFFMQNWDHIVHLFNHLHLKPKELHGTDVSRVRQWCLNLWAKYYRQTLVFSSVTLPEINSIFNKKCLNFAGRARIANGVEGGCMNRVFVQVPHVFHKFHASSPADAIERRFRFFLQKVLPEQRDSSMKQTLIYVPSYFDYVKLRNHFKREDIGFVQICEYSKEAKVARARDMFFHGDAHFLIYTERHHFFHRIRVKGIRHLVFYQPPNFPHFYYELCNLMQEANQNRKLGPLINMTVTVIYSKYDVLQLSAVVGTERAVKMLNSDRDVHMMVTGAE